MSSARVSDLRVCLMIRARFSDSEADWSHVNNLAWVSVCRTDSNMCHWQDSAHQRRPGWSSGEDLKSEGGKTIRTNHHFLTPQSTYKTNISTISSNANLRDKDKPVWTLNNNSWRIEQWNHFIIILLNHWRINSRNPSVNIYSERRLMKQLHSQTLTRVRFLLLTTTFSKWAVSGNSRFVPKRFQTRQLALSSHAFLLFSNKSTEQSVDSKINVENVHVVALLFAKTVAP